MGEARESEELGRERDYLSARLEETSRELARLDLQNASLSLERRQAVVAFRFIGLLHERAEEAATVEGLYRRVVEAITVDLSADAAALLRIDPQTGDVSVVAAAGLPEDAEFSGLSAASPGCDLTRPTFVNSKSTLRPFHDVVRSRARLPYFVWYPITGEPDGLWVLFAANRMEDLQLKHPFSEATLEIFGAISSALLLRRERILRTQDLLRQREQRIEFLAEIVRTSPISVVVTDGSAMITYVNPATERLYGYDAGELVGQDSGILNAEASGVEIQRSIVETASRGEVWRGELLSRSKGGKLLHIHATVFGLADATGTIRSLVGFQEDITEQKQAEEALRQSERRYRELADLLPQVACETDARGNLTFVNRNAFDAFGYTPEDLGKGLNIFQMLAPEELEKARERFSRVLLGAETEGFEYTALRRDGSTFPVIIYAMPIIRNGRPEGVRAVVVDITERQRAEEERQKMQRLESIGVLAGGIAHDFNNILTGILGNISLIARDPNLNEATARRLMEAEAASVQARSLTQQLLTFSTGGAPVKRTVAGVGLLKDTVEFSLRGASVVGRLSLPGDLWPVEVDEGQIGQVVSNLVINGQQAMPEGGTIEVTAENVTVTVDSSLPIDPGRYVRISVKDHGTGIPAAHLPRIFDPYFTTKQEGSGLGLAVCYSVVRRHEGHIAVESDLGVGSIFHVYLPASAEPPPDPTSSAEAQHRGTGRVLIMDDEEIVRYTAGGILEETGYEVAVAEDGEEAIQLYMVAMAAGKPFDVVLLDLTVRGGMGGKACLLRLREMDPDVKAIVSSGHAADPVMAEYRDHGFSDAIPKPYKMAELSAVVQRLLAQGRQGEGRSR